LFKQAQIHKAKEDLIAAVRSLASDEELQVEFAENNQNNFFTWDNFLVKGDKKFSLPEINEAKDFSEESLTKDLRASSDMALCYYLFHQKKLQENFLMAVEDKRILSDFEKIRLLANMENLYLGSVKNILQKIESDIFFDSQNLSLLLLKAIFPKKILPRTKDLSSDLSEKFSKKILSQVEVLAKNISNQKAFALETVKLLDMIKKENEAENSENESEEDSEKSQDKKEKLESFGSETAGENEQNFENSADEESAKEEEKKIEEQISELKEGDAEVALSLSKGDSEADKNKIEFINAYKIYTAQFDEVVFPQKLISKHDLDLLYDQLDLKLAKLSDISRKMSLKLRKKLLSKRNSLVEFDASRGVLNRKKLTRLVFDPMLDDIWINNREHEYQNTALTILLDNSGSMRGSPIVMSAMACKIIAEILEKFSVKTEIIGFTTVDWKGGRARKAWEMAGRPKNPGRLTELRHIIYKSFNQNLKKSKTNLGLMLREGILKENIDGEALLFARSRLMQQSEKRKILMVISDGTPIDDSTLAANDNDILSNHLTHVVNKIEKAGKIEIVGIGIGHDTGNFYNNSMTIRDLEDLGDVMIEKLCEIL
jgi:cobaltochelatase CobT